MIIGRKGELTSLARLAAEDGPCCAFIWGIPGIGKSTLLQAFIENLQPMQCGHLVLDCGLIEPTERGFRKALGSWLEEAGSGDSSCGRLLILDTYETFGLMDSWLLKNLRPRLGPDLKLLLCGRIPPSPGWRLLSPGQSAPLLQEIGGLSDEASRQLLIHLGLEGERAEALIPLAYGHPLTLNLAAATLQDSAGLQAAPLAELLNEISAIYLAEVSHARTRRALEAASVTRRLTRSILAELIPDADANDVFDELSELSFTRLKSDGLHIHEAVKAAIATRLRASDPELFRTFRRRAWRQCKFEMDHSSAQLWNYTADLIYLVDNAVVREAFFPSSEPSHVVENATADDAEEILGIARRHDSQRAVDGLQHWLETCPHAFHVVRQDNQVEGFYCVLESERLTPAQTVHDPVVRAWCGHLNDEPVARDAPALFIRRWLARESGEAPSAIQAACWLDLKRAYMDMRPDLRRVYLTVSDLGPYAAVATELGFQHLAPLEQTLDGMPFHSAMLDFGAASVDGWITRLVASELDIIEGSLVDTATRQLVFEGARQDLTPLEFGVLEILLHHSEKPVSRETLLAKVWGQHDEVRSNVVDVIISALRRKLPGNAGRIDTMRGLGYRFVPAAIS